MWRTGCMILLATLCLGHPARDTQHSNNEIELSDCLQEDLTSCLKYKFFSYVDNMIGQKDNFALTKGVSIVKSSDDTETGAPRALDPSSRLKDYLDTHSLRVEVEGTHVIEAVSRAGQALRNTLSTFVGDNEVIEEGRARKKGAAMIIGLVILVLALKMFVFIPMGIVAVALIAGKALITGIIALAVSAIVGLKSWVPQQNHVIYDVVPYPPPRPHPSSRSSSNEYRGTNGYGTDFGGYSSSDGYGRGHGSAWRRSLETQTLAYSEQIPQ